jgi:uncharacterized membrane protein
MKTFVGYFARGCLTIIPLAATIYLVWAFIRAMDDLLGISIPGLGLVVAVAVITLVGFLVSNVVGRQIYELFDKLMERLPVVKLLYKSIRDLLETFAGDEKTTGQPVSVRLSPQSEHRVMGLLTRDDLTAIGMPDHVAVYLPQAYNIGGQVLAIRRDQVELLDVSSAEMLTFMMSGGASGFGAYATATPPPTDA